MSWWHWILAYVAGFVAVQLLFWWALREEPTSHGHIVGHQIGCLVGLTWPLSVPPLLVFAVAFEVHQWWREWRS